MAYRIVLRRDTSTNWTSNNPVLLLGEPGYETDSKKLKIGDGESNWENLEYTQVIGPTGPQGIQGVTGPTGDIGPTGPTGGFFTYDIGEYAASQGGVIFHRYKDGTTEHYLVVAITDISPSYFWSNIDNVAVGITAQSTWDGLSNSIAINRHPDDDEILNNSAQSCLAYSVGAISGWYLPAIDELSLLWQNRFNINRTLSGNSSFGSIPGTPTQILFNNYWSSTEQSSTNAWYFNFSNGSIGDYNKGNTYYVRAIRSFSI